MQVKQFDEYLEQSGLIEAFQLIFSEIVSRKIRED
jgi:hypothetical protein